MDHEAAAKTHAIERYLLGEMPASERDDFEDHYFTCAECADEIRFASETIGDLKATLSDAEISAAPERPRWRNWFRFSLLVPAYASVLTLAAVYQTVAVIPDLEKPRAVGAAVILDGRTRGDVPAVASGAPLEFLTAMDPVKTPRVWVEIGNPSGRVVRSGEIAAPAGDRPLDVYFPGSLAAGRYQLVVKETQGGRELARSAFEVVQH